MIVSKTHQGKYGPFVNIQKKEQDIFYNATISIDRLLPNYKFEGEIQDIVQSKYIPNLKWNPTQYEIYPPLVIDNQEIINMLRKMDETMLNVCQSFNQLTEILKTYLKRSS
jgi:histone acetyltransferase (RNA polymerase elongator complex component)